MELRTQPKSNRKSCKGNEKGCDQNTTHNRNPHDVSLQLFLLRLGRRITFFAIVGLAIGTGYGAVVVNSFALFAAMRFINALLDVQIEQLPYIICKCQLLETAVSFNNVRSLFVG